MSKTKTTFLWRPVDEKELKLILDSGSRRFPPRLPEQPIFYPVCNEQYASEIAKKWNTRNGRTGYVTRFAVKSTYLSRYAKQVVGASYHEEYWIPAEDLDALNDAIVGEIEIIAEYKQ